MHISQNPVYTTNQPPPKTMDVSGKNADKRKHAFTGSDCMQSGVFPDPSQTLML